MLMLPFKQKDKMVQTTKNNTGQRASQRTRQTLRVFAVVLVAAVISGVSFGPTLVTSAQSLQEQINQLSNENKQTDAEKQQLAEQAVSLEDKINKLAQQIYTYQKQINENQAKITDLQNKIAEKEVELAQQKKVLGNNIKQMYLEGDISTLEMLASSKNISDFVDKQQYRNAVKDKIKTTLDKITELKFQMKAESEQVQKRLEDQKRNQAELDGQRSEQNGLLGLNEGQRSELDSKIKGNNKKIEELKRQQALENVRLFGGGGGGTIGGGGYPWGSATCLHTGQVDGACPNYDWAVGGNIWNYQTGGYGYRNCTDWVAYRIIGRTGYVPSGLGNAKDWPGNAQSRGYAVDHSPRAGDAAVSTAGYYGHVMYVESVNGDGSIVISDYNRAGTGKYNTSTISPSNLYFIHF